MDSRLRGNDKKEGSMIKSKAIDILKTFTPEEFGQFGKFVRSPYFNNNGKLTAMYAELKKYYPDFAKRTFTKENFYANLFPGRKYNDGTMRKLLSGMQKLEEEYIAHSNFDKVKLFEKTNLLMTYFDQKKLDKIFNAKILELDKTYKDLTNFEDDYFRRNFELEVARINFDLGRDRASFEPEKIRTDLLRCSAYMICYSLITALKLGQDIFVTKLSYDFDYRDTIAFKFIDSLGPGKFIDSIKKYAPEFYPVILIYFNRFMIAAGLDGDDAYYYELKEIILKNIGLFTRFERYNLMLFLENSCEEKVLSGKGFNKELHSVHREMLSRNLFTAEDEDYFSVIRFRGMVRCALLNDEFAWTEAFLGKYLDKLPKQFRDNMNYYTRALLYFHRRMFGEALENVSKVKFETYRIKFDVWALKLQTEFELDYYEEALYSIDSFRHSLRNDTTSPQWIKARFSNFINYFHKILKMKDGQEKSEADILREEISKSKEVLEKDWLLEKLKIS